MTSLFRGCALSLASWLAGVGSLSANDVLYLTYRGAESSSTLRTGIGADSGATVGADNWLPNFSICSGRLLVSNPAAFVGDSLFRRASDWDVIGRFFAKAERYCWYLGKDVFDLFVIDDEAGGGVFCKSFSSVRGEIITLSKFSVPGLDIFFASNERYF